MSDPIAKVYADLVRAGRRTIAQVPETIRPSVEQLTNSYGGEYSFTQKSRR